MTFAKIHARRARRHRGPSIWRTLKRWLAIERERRALARLTDSELRDIGLTREQALRESRRAPWDIVGR